MIKKILVSILFFIAIATYAQEATSSVYSIHGIGIQKYRGTVANTSMGGLTLYSNSASASVLNPALYGDLKLTSFQVGGSYSASTVKTNEAKDQVSAVSFDYLSIAIPAKKFGFGFGLIPYTSVGYEVEELEADGKKFIKGSGGVNRVYFGAGVNVFKGFKLGADFQYNFGRIENESIKFFSDINNGSTVINGNGGNNSRNLNQSDVSGVSYTISGVYDFNFKTEYKVRASVVYNGSSNFNFKNSRERALVSTGADGQVFIQGVSIEVIDVENRAFSIPTRVTFGTSILKPQKWFLGTEVFVQKNGGFRDHFQNREKVRYTNAYGARLGGYYQPNYNSLTNYFARIIYRGGIRYEDLGLEFNNKGINEFGISFGLSLPLPRGSSSLDLGVEYGSRGTTSVGVVKEDFWNLSLGLSLSDKWFRKRKFD